MDNTSLAVSSRTTKNAGIDGRIRELTQRGPHRPAVIVVDISGREEVLTWGELDQQTRGGDVSLVRTSTDLATVTAILRPLRAGHVLAVVDRNNRAVTDTDATTMLNTLEPAASGVAMLTGGTSGIPRLVHRRNWPQWNPLRPAPLLFAKTGWRAGQTQLLIGGWSHAASLTHLLEGILGGNTLVVPSVFDPALVFAILEKHRPEWTQLSPAHLQILAPYLSERRPALNSLLGVVHTGGPCPDPTRLAWIDAIGSARLWEIYAATEGMGLTLCRADEWLERPGTVGRGFMTRIRIYRDGVPVPPGEVGTVFMRTLGAQTNGPDGFTTVNDLGQLDGDGYLYLTGRADDMVTVGGENVHTERVATTLLRHSSVRDAAVIAVPDPVLGHRLIALVVGIAETERTGLLLHCLRALAPHEIPGDFRIVDDLGRSVGGKTNPVTLRRLAGLEEEK